MRTTVSLSEELLLAAKERARQTGRTVSQVLEAGLRRELAQPARTQNRPAVPVFDGVSGPRPGIDLTSNVALAEALDEDVPLTGRR